MATVLGIEADGYDLTDLGSNASLGMESAELMRRVNERLRDRSLPVPRYNKVFKRYVAKQVLASRKGEESKVLLPTSLHPWARERAEQQIGAIEGSGARVVGDLDDLRPSFAPSAERQQEAATPDAEAVLDAAVHALVTVALEPPRRRKRGGKPGAAKRRRRPGPLRGAWYDVSRRVRGRSPRDLVAAAERRARGLLQRRR